MTQRVVLGDGALTLAGPNLTFNARAVKVLDQRGNVEALDWTVEIEADVVGDLPSDVWSGSITQLEEVTEQYAERRVQVQLDGVDQIDLEPGECFWGPHVISCEILADDGAGDSHYRVHLTVQARVKVADVYELFTSITVEKVNGKIVRKIWTATCKADTVTTALSKVLSFKPSETFVKESITRKFQEARAEATWIWEAEKSKVVMWKCRVSYGPGGGRAYLDSPNVGVQGSGQPVNANVFLRRRLPLRITVQGVIISKDPNIVAPAKHFSAGANIKEEDGLLVEHDVEVESVADRTYRLEYEEHWIVYAGTIPAANHADDHHLLLPSTEPADGGISGS